MWKDYAISLKRVFFLQFRDISQINRISISHDKSEKSPSQSRLNYDSFGDAHWRLYTPD